VRADDAALDPILYAAVRDWLRDAWPFERVDYAPRPTVTLGPPGQGSAR
jgi:hypothetical protein